jgi:hypothetical protein
VKASNTDFHTKTDIGSESLHSIVIDDSPASLRETDNRRKYSRQELIVWLLAVLIWVFSAIDLYVLWTRAAR